MQARIKCAAAEMRGLCLAPVLYPLTGSGRNMPRVEALAMADGSKTQTSAL